MRTHPTDRFWQSLGDQDAYWGVLTRDEFRTGSLTTNAIDDLYSTGEAHIAFVYDVIRKHLDENFSPASALDYGCGVGRLVIPLAERCQNVVGVDVSDGMLQKAQARCDQMGASNVRFVRDGGQLSDVTETFDLVHSCIVFQHIPCQRGVAIASRLLQRLNHGGVGVLHFTYYKKSRSRRPALRRILERMGLYRIIAGLRDLAKKTLFGRVWEQSVMQMNTYDLNTIFMKLHDEGVGQVNVQLTDHDGVYGVVLCFRK